ncbi:MAG: hypothetical protein R6W77_10295 [Trueperaceae bacterium]
MRVTLADLLRFFARVAALVVVVAGPVAILTFVLANRTPAVYEAEAVVLAPLREVNVDLPGAAPEAADPLQSQVYAAALHSEALLRDAVTRLSGQASAEAGAAPSESSVGGSAVGGVDDPGAERALVLAIDELDASVALRYDEERASNLLRIAARAPTAALAIERANAVTAALVAWDDGRAREDAALLVRTLAGQLEAYEQQIAELRALGSRTAIAELPAMLLLASDRRQQLALARSTAVAARGQLEILQPATRAGQVYPNPIVDAFVAAVLTTGMVIVVLLVFAGADRRARTGDGLARAAGMPLLADFAHTNPIGALRGRGRTAAERMAHARPDPGHGASALPYLTTRVRHGMEHGGRLLVVGVAGDDAARRVATALVEALHGSTPRVRVGTGPAVLASATSLTIATEADAVVLVADPRATERAAARRAAHLLMATGTPVLGVVAARRDAAVRDKARPRLRYPGA